MTRKRDREPIDSPFETRPEDVVNKVTRAGIDALRAIGSGLTEFLAFVIGDPARNYLTRPLFGISQPTRIVRHVAELSQHSRFAEITRGRIASLLSIETPLDCLGVFAHRLAGKTDENRNSDDQ
jgi:hypothetical protein